MGIGWSDLNPIHAVQHTLHHANEMTKKHYNGNSVYIGTDGVYYGPAADAVMETKLPAYNYGNTGKPRPNSGYSRTTAATAKDIAQGGMTKDEVIEFNMKHPNETAKRSE